MAVSCALVRLAIMVFVLNTLEKSRSNNFYTGSIDIKYVRVLSSLYVDVIINVATMLFRLSHKICVKSIAKSNSPKIADESNK